MALFLGCGEGRSLSGDQNRANAKAEPIKATLTPGMEAAGKAHEAGNYREAVRLYTMELVAEEAKSAPSWVQLSYLHNELGVAFDHSILDGGGLYQYGKALEHYQKALAIDLKQLGPDHPDVASSYNNIGAVHLSKGEYDHALENFQKAITIDLKTKQAEHPDVASSYNNIGLVHESKGEYDKALEYYRKALVINLKQLGADHPAAGKCYWSIGVVWKAKKDLPKAKEFIGKGHAILLEKLGSNHPYTKHVKSELAALKEELKRKE